MAVLSPDEKKNKVCKIRRKFYEEKCHVRFFAERFALIFRGAIREQTGPRNKEKNDPGNVPVMSV